MSSSGDYGDEMLRRPLDDQATEALLTGRMTGEEDFAPLVEFLEDVRQFAGASVPVPTQGLAAVLAEGFSIEKGDLLVTAASNVPGPAPQAAGLPNRRRRNMIEALLAKLAAAGLAAKAGLAAGALTMTATAAATTGTLPGPVQDQAADAIEKVIGLDIPGGRSSAHRQDGDHRKDGSQVAEENKTGASIPDNFGTGVSDRASSGEPKSGADFGRSVSTDARANHQPATAAKPATTPTAESNPGTSHRPAETPTAESNPGSSSMPGETPTAESNPGTSYRPGETPTGEENPGTSRRP